MEVNLKVYGVEVNFTSFVFCHVFGKSDRMTSIADDQIVYSSKSIYL